MKIDTWDQEYATLTIDGTVYNVGQYGTAIETVDICGNACADYLYPIVKNVTHSSTSLTVIISSTLDQGNYDESWGIRELYILIDYVITTYYYINSQKLFFFFFSSALKIAQSALLLVAPHVYLDTLCIT